LLVNNLKIATYSSYSCLQYFVAQHSDSNRKKICSLIGQWRLPSSHPIKRLPGATLAETTSPC